MKHNPLNRSILPIAIVWAATQTLLIAQTPPPANWPKHNYRLECLMTGVDGQSKLFSLTTCGGPVRGEFMAPGPVLNGNEVPATVQLDATLEVVSENQVWLRQLFVGQTIPYVTGSYGYQPQPARAIAPVAPPVVEDPLPPPPTAPKPPAAPGTATPSAAPRQPAVRKAPPATTPAAPVAPPAYVQYQQMKVGLTSTVVLTVDKPLVISEDANNKVTLTLRVVKD